MTKSIQPQQYTSPEWSNQDAQPNKLLNRNHHQFRLGNLYQTLIGTAALCLGYWGQTLPTVANPLNRDQTPNLVAQNSPQPETLPNNSIDISPEIINSSPVLQKWLKGIPNVLNDIKTEPSFRTRVKVGYSQYPSTNQAGGFHLAVDDVFFGRGGLSASANYNSSSTGNRTAYGADAQYYLLPLGGYLNITPLVGFRHLETDKYKRDGLNLGAKIMVVPARGGGADVALSQSWVGFGSATETGLTTLSVGYALTEQLRLSTDIQQQNAKENYDSRVGFGVEWMP
jgi:hypothetical protein